jgi:hypothetical protein
MLPYKNCFGGFRKLPVSCMALPVKVCATIFGMTGDTGGWGAVVRLARRCGCIFFWVMTPCSLGGGYQCLRRICCFHF